MPAEYAAIVDQTDRQQFPTLLAIVASRHAAAWRDYFQAQGSASADLAVEPIAEAGQVDEYLTYGLRAAQWIAPLADDLRRAGVDARRAAEGLAELHRGPEAWWRGAPVAGPRDWWPAYLPWVTLPPGKVGG